MYLGKQLLIKSHNALFYWQLLYVGYSGTETYLPQMCKSKCCCFKDFITSDLIVHSSTLRLCVL